MNKHIINCLKTIYDLTSNINSYIDNLITVNIDNTTNNKNSEYSNFV